MWFSATLPGARFSHSRVVYQLRKWLTPQPGGAVATATTGEGMGVLPPLRMKKQHNHVLQSLLPAMTQHCWLSQCRHLHHWHPLCLRFNYQRLKGLEKNDVEMRWNCFKTTRKRMRCFSHRCLLRLLRMLPWHRPRQEQHPSGLPICSHRCGRGYQPSPWEGVSASPLLDTPTLPTLPESPLRVVSSAARAALAACTILVSPPLLALSAPPPTLEPSRRTSTPPALVPSMPMALPSTSPPSSPPPPRAANQEGWDLCTQCRRHYHHKMYHCWFCNFK